MRIKLTKIEGKNTSSIDVGYWVDGWGRAPEVGHPVRLNPINSTSENERFDWFSTTTVLSIDGDVITTKNSKWRVS